MKGLLTIAIKFASTAVTATTVPQAPTIGAVAGENVSATVAYTAGATGGASATYTATSSPGGFTGMGSSPITVSGLTNGTGTITKFPDCLFIYKKLFEKINPEILEIIKKI